MSAFEFEFHCSVFDRAAICFCQPQLSATDASARTTMKGAAKCDKRCELQNSVNQQGFERILCFRDIPESIPVSVSISFAPCRIAFHGCMRAGVFVSQGVLLDSCSSSVTHALPTNQ